MTSQPALVFFDLDGTLLDKQHRPVPSAVAAIRQLRANGHLTYINTGRCMAMINQEIIDVGFDGIIAGCGTHVIFNGHTIHNLLMPTDLLNEALRLMVENHVDFWLEGPECVYLDTLTSGNFHNEFIEFFHNWLIQFNDFRQGNLRVNKFSYECNARSNFAPVEAFIRKHFDLILHRPEHGEVLSIGYSKATGMALIKDLLRRPDALTYAFGDSLNDLDMLKAADVGVAMGGSMPHLIEHSDHLTDAPDDHGIEKALRHYQLIE
ncbi:MAG: HAD family hydrolase [Eubacteriales bacterium]|nr:HAD family hydrolase [Eubacteriales bacterium]